MSVPMTPARRLLAILEEERSLETRPLDEILADLEAHGIDPAGPTRLARRLAERNAGPAAALLGAVIEDEATEAEIAALESADLDSVRERLEAGTVATVTAEAQRRAGAPSNVVGLRRRRSAAWAWAGSLVGMAACALIVVGVWWPPEDRIAPVPEPAAVEIARPMANGAADADSGPPEAPATSLSRLAAPSAEADGEMAELMPEPPGSVASPSPIEMVGGAARRQAEPESRNESEDTPADSADPPSTVIAGAEAERGDAEALEALLSAPSGRSGGLRVVIVPEPDSQVTSDAPPTTLEAPIRREAVATPDAVAPLPPRRPESPALADAGLDDTPGDADSQMSVQAREPAGAESAPVSRQELIEAYDPPQFRSGEQERGIAVVPRTELSALPPAIPMIVAFLPVDPLIAPSQAAPAFAEDRRVRAAASDEEALDSRLPEARRAAAGRHVVALATIQEAGQSYDAVIVLRDPAAEPPSGPRDPVLAMLYGERAEVFEQIRLPPRPTGAAE